MGSLLANPHTWVAIAFTLFFLLFGKRIVEAARGALDGHANRVRAELEEASRLRTEAEALLRDVQARREAAIAEARSMLSNARAEAARVAQAARQEAEQAAARRERMAMDRIAAAEKAAVTEVRQEAAELASRAAGAVIARSLDAQADADLINRAIDGLPAALSGRRAA